MEIFLLHQDPTDAELLDALLSTKTKDIFESSLLETLLRKVYVSRRHLIQKVFHALEQDMGLYLTFLTLFTKHIPSPLCSVFQYMVRKGLFETSESICCLKCMGSLIRYSRDKANLTGSRLCVFGVPNPVETIVRSTLQTLRGQSILSYVLYCILESDSLVARQRVLESFLMNVSAVSQPSYTALVKLLQQHPLTPYQVSLPLVKQRIAPFHEALIAKTWHPSRFVPWCLDIEEQAEISELPQESSQTQ